MCLHNRLDPYIALLNLTLKHLKIGEYKAVGSNDIIFVLQEYFYENS